MVKNARDAESSPPCDFQVLCFNEYANAPRVVKMYRRLKGRSLTGETDQSTADGRYDSHRKTISPTHSFISSPT